MKNITETIERYVSAWDEKTTEAIKAILVECCDPKVTYKDKQTPMISGIDELVSLIMQSYEVAPGRTIWVLTAPEYFDNSCYYSWGINIPGKGDLAGRDYIVYNNENKITEIVGFLPV